jgi:hypothetical protein
MTRPFSRHIFNKATRGLNPPVETERAAGLESRMDARRLRRGKELKRKEI